MKKALRGDANTVRCL